MRRPLVIGSLLGAGAALAACSTGAIGTEGAPSVGGVVSGIGAATGNPILVAAGTAIDALLGPLLGAAGGAVGGRLWAGSARKLDKAEWTADDALAMHAKIEQLKAQGLIPPSKPPA